MDGEKQKEGAISVQSILTFSLFRAEAKHKDCLITKHDPTDREIFGPMILLSKPRCNLQGFLCFIDWF